MIMFFRFLFRRHFIFSFFFCYYLLRFFIVCFCKDFSFFKYNDLLFLFLSSFLIVFLLFLLFFFFSSYYFIVINQFKNCHFCRITFTIAKLNNSCITTGPVSDFFYYISKQFLNSSFILKSTNYLPARMKIISSCFCN